MEKLGLNDAATAVQPAPDPGAGSVTDPRDPIKLGRLLTFVFPAVTMLYAAQNAIGAVLLPEQIADIAPGNKVGALATAATMGAVIGLFALPVGGALSDGTRSRFGKRNPWIFVTGLLGTVVAIALGAAPSLATVTALFALSALVFNVYGGAISAILPERVPETRRGIASAIFGLGTPVGILVGVNIAGALSRTAAYWTLAVLFAACSVVLVIGAKEPDCTGVPKPTRERGRVEWRKLLSAFRSHDFTFAFISRAAFFLGYAVVNGYLLYTLSDFIGEENLPGHSAATGVSIITTISTVMWLVIATTMGWLADKLNRRKAFVAVAAVGLGATMFIPVLFPTWPGMLAYGFLSGGFIGTYFAVDLALMSLVLPDPENQGRDMGILTAGLALPGLFAGGLAGLIISSPGGYTALFCFAAACAAIGGIATWRIRGVR
ncbi:MFS transporter [Streptomyces sp. SAS_270]|uniref:MFS transporter n=1 Tax=Streptomyces sp. SAS_270 TaxID=3412748 RepID=UPI00403D0089